MRSSRSIVRSSRSERARWCESRDVMSSCDAHNVACVNTDVADGEVLSAFAAYVGVALVVLTAFGACARTCRYTRGGVTCERSRCLGALRERDAREASAGRGKSAEKCSDGSCTCSR